MRPKNGQIVSFPQNVISPLIFNNIDKELAQWVDDEHKSPYCHYDCDPWRSPRPLSPQSTHAHWYFRFFCLHAVVWTFSFVANWRIVRIWWEEENDLRLRILADLSPIFSRILRTHPHFDLTLLLSIESHISYLCCHLFPVSQYWILLEILNFAWKMSNFTDWDF